MCPVTPPWTLILLLSSVPSLAEDLVSFGSNITMCSSLFNNLVRLRTPYSLNSLLSRLSFPLLIALPLSFSTTGILYIWLCTVCISVLYTSKNELFPNPQTSNYYPFRAIPPSLKIPETALNLKVKFSFLGHQNHGCLLF